MKELRSSARAGASQKVRRIVPCDERLESCDVFRTLGLDIRSLVSRRYIEEEYIPSCTLRSQNISTFAERSEQSRYWTKSLPPISYSSLMSFA